MNGIHALYWLENTWWVIALIAANAWAFALMGLDKARARGRRRRVPERTLLLSCACFASVGGILGMLAFRHKTRHMKFVVGVPAMLALHAAIILIWVIQ